jgi:hypothetical protein
MNNGGVDEGIDDSQSAKVTTKFSPYPFALDRTLRR